MREMCGFCADPLPGRAEGSRSTRLEWMLVSRYGVHVDNDEVAGFEEVGEHR